MDLIAQQFGEALDKAVADHDKACDDARTVRDDALRKNDFDNSYRHLDQKKVADLYDEIHAAYYHATDAAHATLKNARAAAWDLLATSAEPQVAFIGKQVRTDENEVRIVLPILPATRAQLLELRREQGWCSDFTDYLRGAIRYGVVTDDRSAERVDLDDYLEDEVNSSAFSKITELVDAVVAAAVARALSAGQGPSAA